MPSDHAPLVIDIDSPGYPFDAGWVSADSRIAARRGTSDDPQGLPQGPKSHQKPITQPLGLLNPRADVLVGSKKQMIFDLQWPNI